MTRFSRLNFPFGALTLCVLSFALIAGQSAAQSVKATEATEEWVATFDGSASQYDDAVEAVIDSAGNVYVTGSSGNDFATVKYDKTGAELWRARYSATGTSSDYAKALAVDAAGNVYVAGQATGLSGSSYDYMVVKYDASGVEQWVRSYDGGGSDTLYDLAVAAVGGQTYIYVTGGSPTGGASSSADYATVKYDAAGTELWVARYDAAGSTDHARALVVDGAGNAYVTGHTYQAAPESRRYYTTVKYDSAGTEQWVVDYSGAAGSDNYAYNIGFDSSGNIVVTGSTETVQYNPAGVEQWATSGPAFVFATDNTGNTYITGASTSKLDATGAVAWSVAGGRAITVDGNGAVYVVSDPSGDTSVDINNHDLLTTKYDTDGTELWSSLYDSGENHREFVNSVAVYVDSGDGLAYVIVSGDSESDLTQQDYATVKYAAADGVQQWAVRFDGLASSNSEPNGLAVDSGGNVYVAGFADKNNSAKNYVTAKYSPTGSELWVQEHDFAPGGAGTQEAEGVVVDSAGNAYVTGSYSTADIYGACGTVKYDADGVVLWAATSTFGFEDECYDIGMFVDSSDGQTYTYVAGTTRSSSLFSSSDFLLIKYNSSGAEQWARDYSYIGGSDYYDLPTAFVVGNDGNAYLAGQSTTVAGFFAATVVAFDKNGNELWDNGYAILNDDSEFTAVTVDESGNVYLTGYSGYRYWLDNREYTNWDLVTAKYDASGTELWVARYGEVRRFEKGEAIGVDSAGNVYVGGFLQADGSSLHADYVLIKYNASGVEQWVRTFDGGIQGADYVKALVVDSADTIYITGQSHPASSRPDYTTIAYDSAGNQLWFERYDGGGNIGGNQLPTKLVVTDDGNVYVTGISSGATTREDFGTVKYSQALVTSDTEMPLITAVSPLDGATDVSPVAMVTATFSEAMAPAKVLDPATFTVHDTATGANYYGVVTYDEATQTAQFDTTSFTYETSYTATLRAGATDLAGNPIAPQTWSFTIEPPPDRTPPTLVSVTPTNGTTGTLITPTISATFDEPMAAGSFSASFEIPEIGVVSDGTFQLLDNVTVQQVFPSSASYDAATMTATLNLAAPLEINRSYTATITTDVYDLAFNRLAVAESWTFTTGALGDTTPPEVFSVSPAHLATDVAVDIVSVYATFNEAVGQDQFLNSVTLFTLKETATGVSVSGGAEAAGATATFYLGAPLSPDTNYTATILGTAENISNIAMGADYSWTFTTAGGVTPTDDQTAPRVVSVTPDGTRLTPVQVGLLTVTFSEAMSAATIAGSSDGSSQGAPFTVQVSGGAFITGTVEYDSGAMTARFLPDVDLEYDTTYQATLRADATDLAGNALGADYPWSFTTAPDPGTLGCDVDAGILAGCVNFDDFTYGTGVNVNTLTIGTTGPVGESALRKEVIDGLAYSTDVYPDAGAESDVESEASAYMDATQIRVEARSRDKVVTREMDGAAAFLASKIDVVGVPPGTLIPMTVTVTRSELGDTYGPELRIYDFDYNYLGPGVVNYGSARTFELQYRATPNNGIVLYFATGAKKTAPSGGAVESDCSATVTFNPPPGVTVTLASGLTFTGVTDSDGDGVPDSEDAAPNDASLATLQAATNTGQVEVAVDTGSGSGVTLSQVESLDDGDISLNQAGKPNDHTFPDGLASFQVMGLPVGGTATVTIIFPTTIPTGSSYYKVGPDGFYLFPTPVAPGDPGATIDYATNTVTLTLVDGGAGDHDLVANGVIDDPGGIGILQDCVAEIWYDGINQSCKAGSDYDQDGDGFELGVDCDDEDASINPDATEIWYDGVNQSCKSGSDNDQDSDSYDSAVHGGNDCDDTTEFINPGTAEIWYDGVNQSCKAGSDYDQDGDGFDSAAESATGDDCNDTDAAVNPGATEIWYDGMNQSCKAGSDYDQDGDGHDSVASGGDDCDDTDATVTTIAVSAEIWYDGINQSCKAGSDYDQDRDGYDSAAESATGDDCDDTLAAINPGATEIWYDGINQSCLVGSDYDQDGDGFDSAAESATGDDCNDIDAAVNPSATEVCGNNLDENCNGDADDVCPAPTTEGGAGGGGGGCFIGLLLH